jgi:HPt (histidine-containing phosphotransfer) domain-containing protein
MKEDLIDQEIDQNSLNAYFGDDNDFKNVVFETFLDEIEDNIAQFRDELEGKLWHELAQTTHKMKPTFAMVGLTKTEKLLKEIESEIKKNGIDSTILSKIELFNSEIPNLLIMVRNEHKSF